MAQTKSFEKAVGKGSKVFRQLFGEIEDPRYSIFNAMANLSGAARTASYFDDIAQKNDAAKAAGERGFFWNSAEEARAAVNAPQTGIKIVAMDDIIKELPGAGKQGALINPISGKFTTEEIAESMKKKIIWI